MTTRRSFLATAGAALLAPALAGAQQRRTRRILLATMTRPVSELTERGPSHIGEMLRELGRLGLGENSGAQMIRVTAAGQAGPYEWMARQILAHRPEIVLCTEPSSDLLFLLMAATPHTPVVSVMADPVATLLVPSLTRPGRNLTGAAIDGGAGIGGKRVQLLHEALPRLRRLGYLVRADKLASTETKDLRAAAATRGIEIVQAPLEVPITPAIVAQAIATLAGRNIDGLAVSGIDDFAGHAVLIAESAMSARLPAIAAFSDMTRSGLLMSYGPNLDDVYRLLARSVDKVLRGASPDNLPIGHTAQFDFQLNLKTARELGLELPSGTRALATAVIE